MILDLMVVIKNIIIVINLFILLSLIPVPGSWVFLVYIITTFLSLIAICLHWYNNIIFDRVMLSLYLYLVAKTAISVTEILPPSVIVHKHFIFPTLIAVGLYTTFLTEAGFIGIVGVDRKSVWRASLALLSIVVFIWLNAFYWRWPGQIAAFLIVAWAYGTLGRQVLSAQLNK